MTKKPTWEAESRKGSEPPFAHNLVLPTLKISVHRWVGYSGEWFLTCPDVRFDCYKIGEDPTTLEDIKARALKLVFCALKGKMDALSNFMGYPP